eukprot:scaffold9287_cov126-Isochrysis_galbana.AAC.1
MASLPCIFYVNQSIQSSSDQAEACGRLTRSPAHPKSQHKKAATTTTTTPALRRMIPKPKGATAVECRMSIEGQVLGGKASKYHVYGLRETQHEAHRTRGHASRLPPPPPRPHTS